MSMAVTVAADRGPRFSIPDRSGRLFRDALRHLRRRARRRPCTSDRDVWPDSWRV